MATEVTLTAAMRSNLISLQQTNRALEATQQRLATGKKVNTALDNPTNFFSAAAHLQRAGDLTSRKDGMMEAVQSIKASDNGIVGMKALLESAKGIVESARSTSTAGLPALYKSFNTVADQINQLIKDSKYKGTNFLDGTAVSLDVVFNETGTNKLTIQGFDAKLSGILATNISNGGAGSAAVNGGFSNLAGKFTAISGFVNGTNAGTATVAGFSNANVLNGIANGLTVAISQLQAQSSKMAANLAIVNARLDFTTGAVNIEKGGADNLTLADMNEEGANMLMLQTRNQLGTTSLSLASQAAQSILRLF